MIKPSHAPLDLCLLSVMRLAGKAHRLAENRKATAISSNLVSYRTLNILMSCTLSCIYPCSMLNEMGTKGRIKEGSVAPTQCPAGTTELLRLLCGEKTLP